MVSESTIEAYDIATRMEIPENDQEIPLYQRVNEELSVKYKGQQKAYESLLSKNIPSRLESNFPVSSFKLENFFCIFRNKISGLEKEGKTIQG